MHDISFKGFAGVALKGDVSGNENDPSVLLVHGVGQSRDDWNDVADALRKAGRRVLRVDLRGHGESEWPEDGRYDFDACVEDLRCVLAQMASRPVVVASSLAGWIATAVIGEDGAHLASGLVLVDAPPESEAGSSERSDAAIKALTEPPLSSGRFDPRFQETFYSGDLVQRVQSAASTIRLPVLFVRGALSRISPADEAGRFAGRFADAEYAEVREAGHAVATDAADLFNATLLDFLERRVPRSVPEYRSGSDARTLRDAMGCFATGVTVVTSKDADGEPVGLTANSFTSVSLDPPLLLVCIANTSKSRAALEVAETFAVNVLHIGQQPTSNLFAKPGEDRFSQTPWETGQHDVPLLSGALANFECRQHAIHEGGDHIILIGEVMRAKFDPRRDPLLYFNGKYRRLHFA